MATKNAVPNMKEWLALAGADGRITPFDLRSLANQAAVIAANELGMDVDSAHEAQESLRAYPMVLTAIDRYRKTSDALASYREQATTDKAEDARLNRERIAAREELVRAMEDAERR